MEIWVNTSDIDGYIHFLPLYPISSRMISLDSMSISSASW